MTPRRRNARRRRATLATVAGMGAVLATGCMKAKEMSGVRARVEEMKQDFGVLQAKLTNEIDTGGGNFNEPVTGWILAAGYAAVPATMFLYLLAHRFRSFRWMKDQIRGKSKT